ncbi:MAG TPA: hypothetical protein PKD72_13045, partial [Gemmatales bacterium]|nr:hypothetical protein [Gemmatales bacterium]
PPAPASLPTSQKITTVGKLNRTTFYTGANPLFYLTKADGMISYYVRGRQLIGMDQQRVKIEGLLQPAMIDGKQQQVILVEKVERLP